MGRRQQIAGTVRYAPYTARPAVCAECGEEFSCPTHTRYKRIVGGIQRVYCGYDCYRVLQRQEEAKRQEQERKREEAYLRAEAMRKAWTARKAQEKRKTKRVQNRKTAEDYRQRIALCLEKIDDYRNCIEQYPVRTRQRAYALRGIRRWREQLKIAETELCRIEEDAHGNCGNDGDADPGERAAGCGD